MKIKVKCYFCKEEFEIDETENFGTDYPMCRECEDDTK